MAKTLIDSRFLIVVCISLMLCCVCIGVVPDDDMGAQLIRIFGQESHAFRKYQRMMYWMPKFKFINPYYVPKVLPNDDIELAKMALDRMSVDLENKLTVYHVSCVLFFSFHLILQLHISVGYSITGNESKYGCI